MDREQAFKDYCQTTPRGGRLECVNWEEQAFKAGAAWQADQVKAAIEAALKDLELEHERGSLIAKQRASERDYELRRLAIKLKLGIEL